MLKRKSAWPWLRVFFFVPCICLSLMDVVHALYFTVTSRVLIFLSPSSLVPGDDGWCDKKLHQYILNPKHKIMIGGEKKAYLHSPLTALQMHPLVPSLVLFPCSILMIMLIQYKDILSFLKHTQVCSIDLICFESLSNYRFWMLDWKSTSWIISNKLRIKSWISSQLHPMLKTAFLNHCGTSLPSIMFFLKLTMCWRAAPWTRNWESWGTRSSP